MNELNFLSLYVKFCKKFQNFKIPALNLNFNRNRTIYINLILNRYQITSDEINKATSIIFLMSIFIITSILILLIEINIIFAVLTAILLSILISYYFNNFLFKLFKKIATKIEKVLPFIKIDYSILNLTLNYSLERSVLFIDILNSYLKNDLKLSLLYQFIQSGMTPETSLLKLVTPSKKFNDFVKLVLSNQYDYNYLAEIESKTLQEKEISVYIKNIDSKISVIFFIGLFFPIGLCFIILFKVLALFLMLVLVGIFFLLMRYLFAKFFTTKVELITLFVGKPNQNSKMFDEYFKFFSLLSNFLCKNLSPEVSIVRTINSLENDYSLLRPEFSKKRSLITSLHLPLNYVIDDWLDHISMPRFKTLLKSIKRNLTRNSYRTSNVIDEILKFLLKIRNYEKELELILKSEKFKVYLFIILLPLITGALGGVFPFFMSLSEYFFLQNPISNVYYTINYLDVLVIYVNLFICNLISSNYFLKVLNIRKRSLIFVITELLYSIAYYLSLLNTLSLFR